MSFFVYIILLGSYCSANNIFNARIPRFLTKPAINVLCLCAAFPSFIATMPCEVGAIDSSPKTIETNIIGKVNGPTESSLLELSPQSALYITIRPYGGVWSDRIKNVKQPAILSKRIPMNLDSVFPMDFTVSDSFDLTPEGAASPGWKSQPLLMAIRYDFDGIAATRSPKDLVGQTVVNPILEKLPGDGFDNLNGVAVGDQTGYSPVEITLTDRGVAGKFLVGSKK